MIGRGELTQEEKMSLFLEREKEMVVGIDLYDGLKIRRISKEDLEDLNSSFLSTPSHIKLPSVKFVLEKSITVKGEYDFQLDQIMRIAVLALRLLKDGYVSGNLVFQILVSEKRQLESSSWEEEGQRPEYFGFNYALNFDEIPALKNLLEKLQGIDFNKRKDLHLACKRFQRAYEEANFEDQLVDHMIAFEALFLKGEKAKSPTGEIIAVACSILLGKNEEEREETRQFLTEAYSIRNQIVHGSEYRKARVDKEYEMSEFVSKIEDYLRESIKKLLD